jgi:MinD-like ATPase involved in chromosome partitioning or flagellar assembly/ActR/RegA family two-component response regulator
MPGKRILIIDADTASRNFIARTFLEQKCEILQAGSAREGLILAWRDYPDLLIVDPAMPDLKGEELAVKLRQDPRTSAIPLVALSSDSNVARIKSCLDSGFNDYIIKSGQAVPVLQETVNRLLGMSAVVKDGGLLIVFASAKGGTGTSSLCANIATMIAHEQPESRVVVMDMVLPIGSIAPIIGYTGGQNIVTVMDMNADEVTSEFFRDQLAMLNTWQFHLLAGAPDPESSNHLKVDRIWDIVKMLKSAYDYVIIDLGRSLSKFSLSLIQHADLLSLIVGTDLSMVSLTKTLWDYLRAKGVDPSSVYTILNRAVGLEGLTKPEAEEILGLEINTAMPYLGSNFALANNQHQPFTLKFPKDTAAIVLKETALEMITRARRSRTG